MQRFLNATNSKAFFYYRRLAQIKRFNSTVSGKSLFETLKRAHTLFGEDLKVQKKIDSLNRILPKNSTNDYLGFQPSTICLGILQSDDIKPGLFLDSLIADPMSSDKEYTNSIQNYRKKNLGSNIKVEYGERNNSLGGGIFACKTPILNHELRLIQDAKLGDGLGKTLSRDLFNDLSFVEINDRLFRKNIKIEGAANLDFTDRQEDDKISESCCQIFIYVVSRISDVVKLNDLPYFVILNESKKETVGSLLVEDIEENNFRVDLDKLHEANSLLNESVSNISEYLNLYQKSNINELLFTLNRETSGYKPLILLLRSLVRDLHLKESDDIKIASELKDEITEWAQVSHFELQSKVSPFLEKVLLKELTKISQLVMNSGDLTLVISNLLNGTRIKLKEGIFSDEIECYGSLKDAAANSHYLEGKIDALFSENRAQFSEKNVDDFLIQLQDEVTNNKLPELQSQINQFLTKEIIATPFTIFALCNVGFIYDFISLNTAIAVTALSIAVTANISQKKIISIISNFISWYLEKLRLYIDNTVVFLGNRLDSRIANYKSMQEKKLVVINELKVAIVELEKADKKLKG